MALPDEGAPGALYSELMLVGEAGEEESKAVACVTDGRAEFVELLTLAANVEGVLVADVPLFVTEFGCEAADMGDSVGGGTVT